MRASSTLASTTEHLSGMHRHHSRHAGEQRPQAGAVWAQAWQGLTRCHSACPGGRPAETRQTHLRPQGQHPPAHALLNTLLVSARLFGCGHDCLQTLSWRSRCKRESLGHASFSCAMLTLFTPSEPSIYQHIKFACQRKEHIGQGVLRLMPTPFIQPDSAPIWA